MSIRRQWVPIGMPISTRHRSRDVLHRPRQLVEHNMLVGFGTFHIGGVRKIISGFVWHEELLGRRLNFGKVKEIRFSEGFRPWRTLDSLRS